MNAGAILTRLYKEQSEWRKADTNMTEVKWMLRGIKTCIKHVKDVVQEQRSNFRMKHPKVDHRHADILYHAATAAIKKIRESNFKAAHSVLKHAVETVPVGFHGRKI